MKDFEPQLGELLNMFLKDFRETDSIKLELDKTMFIKLFQSTGFKTKMETLEAEKKSRIDTELEIALEKLKTGIQGKNCLDAFENTGRLTAELQDALGVVEKDYWETFLSLVIKQNKENEQIQ